MLHMRRCKTPPHLGKTIATAQKHLLTFTKNKFIASVFFLFLLLSFQANAQDKVITGRILDQDGKGLSGSSVSVKNTQVATLTDSMGNFSIHGKVPYIDENTANPTVVPNDHLLWTEIEADLQFAISNLPGRWTDKGRATSWAAKT